jgi:hypothetical protein
MDYCLKRIKIPNMKNFLTILNTLGIIYLVILSILKEPAKDTVKTIDNSKIEYIGDTTINYNQYKENIIHNHNDTTIIVNNYVINQYGDTVSADTSIKAHKYISHVEDDTISGKITALTDGNIFDLKLDYSINSKLFQKKNPFEIYAGVDFGQNMIQPNILMGKRTKVGLGYNFQNKGIIIKFSQRIK